MTSSLSASPSSAEGSPVGTHVIACGAIARHVDDIVRRRNWSVTIHPLPPLLHNRPRDIAAAIEHAIEGIAGSADRIAIAYADCGTYGAIDAVAERHGLHRLQGEHCYDIFGGVERIAGLLEEEPGTYFFTDYLVKAFHRSVVVELGLDRHPELRDDYFGNYRRVVWLAQEPSADLHEAALNAAELMGLPLEVIEVSDVGLEAQLQLLLQ